MSKEIIISVIDDDDVETMVVSSNKLSASKIKTIVKHGLQEFLQDCHGCETFFEKEKGNLCSECKEFIEESQ